MEVTRRFEIRENCRARMVIPLCSSKNGWSNNLMMNIFIHYSLSKIGKIGSHKRLSTASKALIEKFVECGIGPSKIARLLNKTSGSIGNIIVSPQYCTNHIAQGRKNNIGRECMWALEYFQHNSCHEDNFFFKIEVDTNGPVRNIFWADSLSRLAYMMFGGCSSF